MINRNKQPKVRLELEQLLGLLDRTRLLNN
jgi:hypothetical protein